MNDKTTCRSAEMRRKCNSFISSVFVKCKGMNNKQILTLYNHKVKAFLFIF